MRHATRRGYSMLQADLGTFELNKDVKSASSDGSKEASQALGDMKRLFG